MPLIPRLRLVLLASALALPFSAARAQGPGPGTDPFSIQRDIAANPDFDISGLWRSLKIPAALDTVYGKVGLADPRTTFDRCANTCQAELSRASLDDEPGDEVVLAVYQPSKVCRFLVFKAAATATGTDWRFLGYADHDALGQYDPEFRVSFMSGRRYLVVSVAGAQAPGTWLRYDRWYETGTTGLHEVLTLPADGLECTDARSLCRAFGATVVSSRSSARGDEFVVAFTSRYWGDETLMGNGTSGEIPLLTRSMRGVFVRPLKATGPYALAPLDSDIASWEIDTVFHPGALSCRDFLASNMDGLTRITTSPAQSWLGRYLGDCPPSSERTQLLERFAK